MQYTESSAYSIPIDKPIKYMYILQIYKLFS